MNRGALAISALAFGAVTSAMINIDVTAQTAAAGSETFHREVVPILQKNCQISSYGLVLDDPNIDPKKMVRNPPAPQHGAGN